MSDRMPGQGGWAHACGLAGIEAGRPVHVDIDGYPVCLARSAGNVYALRDECTHEPVPLSEGEVTDGAIECWLHGSRFELATGPVLSPPATKPVAVFPARVDGEDVYVRLAPGGEAAAR